MKKTIALVLIAVITIIAAIPFAMSHQTNGNSHLQAADNASHGDNHEHDHHEDGDEGHNENQTGDHEHHENETETEHEEIEFEIRLAGSGQVPAVETHAFGRAEVQLTDNGTAIRFEITVCDIANVTMSHIHVGNSTTNGPVILPLFKAGETPFSSNDGCSELAEGVVPQGSLVTNSGAGINNWNDFVNALRAGNTYINVHTTAHPSGEIRGQLVSDDEGED